MNDTKILWVDIETTGLDPRMDLLLEVGLRITNTQGANLDEVTALVWNPGWRSQLMVTPGVFEMHQKSGLVHDLEDLDRNPRKYSPAFISSRLCEWLATRLGEGYVGILPMAGNSVHFDRSFLAEHMPDLLNWWHYRNLDISSMREACRILNPKLFAHMPPHKKTHRPQADITESIMLWSWLADNFFWVE